MPNVQSDYIEYWRVALTTNESARTQTGESRELSRLDVDDDWTLLLLLLSLPLTPVIVWSGILGCDAF